MINKIFVADLFQNRQDQYFRDMQLAWHYGYFETVIVARGYITKALWDKKSAQEAFDAVNIYLPVLKRLKQILDFLDEQGAPYDIGVSFSEGRPFGITVGLCLDEQNAVLLRLFDA